MVNLSAAVKLNHSHLRSVDLLNKYNSLGNNICYFVWKLTSNLISIIWQYPSIRYLCSGVSTWAEIVCCRTIFTTGFFHYFIRLKDLFKRISQSPLFVPIDRPLWNGRVSVIYLEKGFFFLEMAAIGWCQHLIYKVNEKAESIGW